MEFLRNIHLEKADGMIFILLFIDDIERSCWSVLQLELPAIVRSLWLLTGLNELLMLTHTQLEVGEAIVTWCKPLLQVVDVRLLPTMHWVEYMSRICPARQIGCKEYAVLYHDTTYCTCSRSKRRYHTYIGYRNSFRLMLKFPIFFPTHCMAFFVNYHVKWCYFLCPWDAIADSAMMSYSDIPVPAHPGRVSIPAL